MAKLLSWNGPPNSGLNENNSASSAPATAASIVPSPKATMSVTWQPSTAPRVSGYRITVYYSDGFVQTAPAAATATSWSVQPDLYNVTAYSVRFSVTTLTDYGWTAESPLTGSFKC